MKRAVDTMRNGIHGGGTASGWSRCPVVPRRRIVTLLVALSTLLPAVLPSPAHAQEGQITAAEFRARLGTLLSDSLLSRASVGIDIVRVEDGTQIASLDAGKLFHPASNMKILTSAAALAVLPPGYAFDTELFADARVRDSVLEGNLYVRGGGDPLFDTLDMNSLASIVELAGIRRIEGDLIGDVSLFDTLSWGKGWQWDDEPSTDEAFLSALSFNQNSVTVTVGPGPEAGSGLSVGIEPVPAYFTIVNLSSTSGRPGGDTVTVRRPAGTNRIIVEGHLSPLSRPKSFDLSVFDPAGFFLAALRSALAARGIAVGGSSHPGSTSGPLFLGRISRRLDEVITRVNKESINLCAENLLKAIGLETTGPPGGAATGFSAVRDYLKGTGLDPRKMILADGSGVSWYNAVAPEDVVAVLTDQYHRKSTFRIFFESLPVSGKDGTLESRMSGTSAAGRVSAKTGTITGVSTLSGYVTTLSNDLLAFSIMINHHPGRVNDLRDIEDRILEQLVLLGPGH